MNFLKNKNKINLITSENLTHDSENSKKLDTYSEKLILDLINYFTQIKLKFNLLNYSEKQTEKNLIEENEKIISNNTSHNNNNNKFILSKNNFCISPVIKSKIFF